MIYIGFETLSNKFLTTTFVCAYKRNYWKLIVSMRWWKGDWNVSIHNISERNNILFQLNHINISLWRHNKHTLAPTFFETADVFFYEVVIRTISVIIEDNLCSLFGKLKACKKTADSKSAIYQNKFRSLFLFLCHPLFFHLFLF